VDSRERAGNCDQGRIAGAGAGAGAAERDPSIHHTPLLPIILRAFCPPSRSLAKLPGGIGLHHRKRTRQRASLWLVEGATKSRLAQALATTATLFRAGKSSPSSLKATRYLPLQIRKR